MTRGFFGVGAQGISKEQNLGNLVRTTHAFGGSFFFTINPDLDLERVRMTDTSDAFDHLPLYNFDSVDGLRLPTGCQLVGVELTDESIPLPSFRHPTRAAYILGPEMGSLSPDMLAKCDHVIRIPMKFCVNVGVAGAIVMYDRMVSLGRFADRPVAAGGPVDGSMAHMPDPVWQPRRVIRHPLKGRKVTE
jgi:tRNA G18 (ribose-2'-O)-methylase SpoU